MRQSLHGRQLEVEQVELGRMAVDHRHPLGPGREQPQHSVASFRGGEDGFVPADREIVHDPIGSLTKFHDVTSCC